MVRTIESHKWYSEQRIEGLKQHYDKLGIPASEKWALVEARLKKEKDPIFIQTEPLE